MPKFKRGKFNAFENRKEFAKIFHAKVSHRFFSHKTKFLVSNLAEKGAKFKMLFCVD